MAGVVPISGKPFRKQWFLQDGPRGSLRGLRSQLAEDGCADSQVVLAKKLLEERCDLDVDTEENAKLAVYWLTKASEQGNLEATKILQHCFTTGHGITEHNYQDAKSCLEMSQQEKLARNAARLLFTALSNGEDFITSEQLRRHLSPASSSRNSPPPLEYLSDPERISESQLVSAAASYSRGLLPSLSPPLPLPLTPFYPPWREPLSFCRRLYHKLLLFSQNSALFTSRFFTLLLILTYCLLGTESLLLFLPLLFYYLSFVLMTFATLQMLHSGTQLSTFRSWSRLFISYSSSLDPQEAEFQFCRNNLKPYGHFFLSLLLNLMIYPLIAHQWTPQSEFTLIAFTLTLLTLLNFSSPDPLVLFSFAIHVLAKYPYELDIVVAQTWRFLDIRVPTFASYVIGNSIEFCLNFRAVFYLLIPAIFLKLAARNSWKGTYQLLIPHCVTLSWWQIAILSSQGATMYGLIRAALALVGVVMFLPIVGVASIILPILALTKYLLADWRNNLATAFLAAAPFGTFWYRRRWFSSAQIILGLTAGAFLIWPTNLDPAPSESLSWEAYQNFCHQPAWEEAPKAQVQVACDALTDLPVTWEGYVTDVKLRRVRNPLRDFFGGAWVPEGVAKKLSCLLGEKADCKEGNCGVLMKLRPCNVDGWNKFEFEVFVKMKSSLWGSHSEIVLNAGHEFKNFSLNIYPGDKIWFKGRLSNGGERENLLGGVRPHVNIVEAQCLLCHVGELRAGQGGVKDLVGVIVSGGKSVLNFVLNPLVIFR
ncbi:GSCOCG00009708001-RA-CDS [Cotesia congregata]|nr:GSCOCG00009708001-RA-CDS [Cotesia congregata]